MCLIAALRGNVSETTATQALCHRGRSLPWLRNVFIFQLVARGPAWVFVLSMYYPVYADRRASSADAFYSQPPSVARVPIPFLGELTVTHVPTVVRSDFRFFFIAELSVSDGGRLTLSDGP